MSQSSIPLLGALCVSAGLVAQDDLDTCLALQQRTNDGTPIGQILVHQGYLSAEELVQMVAHQQHLRHMFAVTRGTPTTIPVPEDALVDIPLYGMMR